MVFTGKCIEGISYVKGFLAEDEIVMREGIKNNIDWQGEGFEFVGDAGDGELAYPIIQKTRPDILITDIKMPFMDGLEPEPSREARVCRRPRSYS